MRFGAHDPAGARLSAAAASAPASPPALALACAGSGRAFLHKLRRVIDQKRVKVQAVRQDEVADVAPPNLRMVTRAQGLQRNRQCRLPGGSTVAGTHRHRVQADRVLPLSVILTCFKCVFMVTSTPAIVPWQTVPFLSSMVTVSLDSFIRNLTNCQGRLRAEGYSSQRRACQEGAPDCVGLACV